jgi:two-component system cell cycle sensor histidine kinase/response regulator CckA
MSPMQGRGESGGGMTGSAPLIARADRPVRGLAGVLIAAVLLLAGPARAADGADGLAMSWVGVAVLALIVGAVAGALVGRRRAVRERHLFASAFDALPVARQMTGRDGAVRASNHAFRQMFDSADAAPDALAVRLIGGDEVQGRLQRLVESARGGTPGQAEFTVQGANGETEWRSVSALPLPGLPGSVMWGVVDVTPRRQVEQIMRQEQERFTDLVEYAPIGFYSVDEEGRFLFVNATLAAWLGLSAEDVTAGTVRLHQVVARPLPSGARPYDPFGGDSALSGEVTLRGPAGREFQAYIRQEVVPGETGIGLRTRSVVHDLSRERDLEKALERTEQHFRRLFEDAPAGIALIDAAGRLETCNAAFRALTGRGEQELKQLLLSDLVAEEDRAKVRERLESVLAGRQQRQPLDVQIAGPGGYVATLYASRREDDRGKPAGLIAHFIDSTDQKRLEQQFTQSQKMQAVGQLAGGIAHDFNNLLTAMIGFCDLLLLRHRAGDQSFADIMQIKQNANRAANLVRQLLAFSRQQTLQPRVLNVTDVLAELSHLLRRLIGENIELEMIHGRDLHPVKVDHGQLEQVIINLAVNARDAMAGAGGKLTIRTSNMVVTRAVARGAETMPHGDYVLIEVVDTGTGIPPDILDRIFEPFFSTKEVGSGTGLGLATVYGIVKQTGGFVFVDSKPGAGSAFSIYLPRHAAAPASDAQRREAGESPPGDLTGIGTVLLVEDEDAVRLFSARALRNKGYNVLEARSGDAALEMMNAHKGEIDLLITDVVMPRMDGPTLIREVRIQRPDMKVIFISGYAEDSFRRKLDENADIHFLPKPFSLKQLAGKVKEVMREGSA